MGVRFERFEFEPSRYELRHDGSLVPMEPQVVEVLAYLIENRDRVVPKEELLDTIWGDRFVSESTLTSRIKAVRRALGDDGAAQRMVQTTRGRGYRFVADVVATPPAEPLSGTTTFLFTDVVGLAALMEQNPVETRAALDRHDQLLRYEIERARGRVFTAGAGSFRAAFGDLGAAAGAAVAAQRVLAAERWPESCPIGVRMGLHVGEAHTRGGEYVGAAVNKTALIAAGGHQGQILASATFAAAAAGRAGLELVDLGEHRLKNLTASERVFQVGSEVFAPIRTLEAFRHNLPVERSVLVGREREIEQVAALVRRHRLVTLLGIGGTGKTRLATAVAADQAGEFADGVWFVDLVPAATPEHVVEAIASAAGLRLDRANLIAALCDLIADRRMLIVLDNCEHITDAVADVLDVLLERTNAPRWLATSRQPLQLPDERQIHVSPLAIDNDLSSPAAQLFATAAERVDVEVGEADLTHVVHICAHLDGIPLSIELAAAQLRHLRIDELAARLDQRFDLLARGRGSRLRRQASLQAVLEDTWEMLDEREQELLLLLAAFPSSFTVDDVDAMCSGTRDGVGVPVLTLAGLVDRSLVAGDGNGNHRLLETVKLFARQRWSAAADPDRYVERHTRWVLEHLGSFQPQDWYTSFALLGWAKAHYDDHRAVEDRLVREGRTEDVVALLRSLTQVYCYETGTKASAVIERVEHLLATLDLSERQRGVLNLVAASAGLPARRPDWIDRGSTAAMTLLRAHGAPEELAAALIIGSWMTVFHDFARAVAMLGEALDVAERAGSPALADVALGYWAGHCALNGELDESLRILGELEQRLDGRPIDYAASLRGLYSLAVHIVADPPVSRAEGQMLEADFAELAGDDGIGWGLPTCHAVAVAACGDIDAARRMVARAEEMTRLTSSDDGLPDLLIAVAALAHALGDDDRARHLLTAVRQSPKPTQTFQLTIMYRLLRNEVGVHAAGPLTAAEVHAVYRDAVAWMDGLVTVAV